MTSDKLMQAVADVLKYRTYPLIIGGRAHSANVETNQYTEFHMTDDIFEAALYRLSLVYAEYTRPPTPEERESWQAIGENINDAVAEMESGLKTSKHKTSDWD